MSTQIGRLSFEDRPEVYQVATGEVTVSGVLVCDSVGKADFLRQQVVALADPKAEKVIPIVVEDGFSGFVRVTRATAEAVGGSMGRGHWFRYAITAIPVLGHELPVVESVVAGAERESVLSVDPHPFHAVPGSRLIHEWPGVGIVDVGEQEDRTVEGGTVDWQWAQEFSVADVFSGVATWVVEPDNWYEGGCQVEALVDGEYLDCAGPRTLADTWRCGNGLVRFWASGTDLWFQWYASSAWSDAVSFTVDPPGGATGIEWQVARVVRVLPHTATVVLTGDDGGTKGRAPALFCTIRRGSPWVDMRATEVPSAVYATTPTAATDVTYGMHRTTAASGWQWMVITSIANDVDTTNGIIDATSGDLLSWAVGAVHSSWSGTNLAIGDVHKEWFAVQSERTVIGQRL